MKHPVVVGLQYGDEGKGKITDTLAQQARWVIRFNGGNNAGHTLIINGKKVVTHSVPSGVMYPDVRNYIGAGCVVDPLALEKEIAELAQAGAKLEGDRLRVDYRAHLILPAHRAADGAREAGARKIGTTQRGIGPAYSTKTDRIGIRAGDLAKGDTELREQVAFVVARLNALVREAGGQESPLEENWAAVQSARKLIGHRVATDPTPFYDVAAKEKCVLEGAQGILLDVDHGSVPFVTSSNTLSAYAAVGSPFPLRALGATIGIAKAYLTRVGDGPFPTELNDETGERIRKNGGEFGSTTGRPRRTGWINLDELRLAVRLSDCTHVVLTKADVLNGEKTVRQYVNGKLKDFAGWDAMEVGNKLHANVEAFITAIEKHIGVPVIAVGTGPGREQLHWRKPIKDFWEL